MDKTVLQQTIDFLKDVKRIPSWDRCPAISTDELDVMIIKLEVMQKECD